MDHESRGYITAKDLLKELRDKNYAVDEADMRSFVRNVLEIKDDNSMEETKISKLIWRIRMHPFFTLNTKNNDKVA